MANRSGVPPLQLLTWVSGGCVGCYLLAKAWKKKRAADGEGEKKLPRPLVLCGPSGVGKGTLLAMLQEDFPGQFGKAVTHTTRAPRQGEVDGVHYHFSTEAEMLAEIKQNLFIEHAYVHNRLYGLSSRSVRRVQETGTVPILELDIQGAETVKKTDLNPYFFFVLPPSLEKLEQRLRGRATESEEAIRTRLNTARQELQRHQEVDFWHHTISNHELFNAYQEFRKLIVQCYPHLASFPQKFSLPEHVHKHCKGGLHIHPTLPPTTPINRAQSP